MDSVINVGEQAPQFQLPDIKGRLHSLNDLFGEIVVLYFWSAECEWCERVDHEITAYLRQWVDQAKVIWIVSNIHESRDLIKRVAFERELPTVLIDAHQHVANLYGTETTPHFFVVDANGKLAYQGAWDDITFRKRVATKVYIPIVIESLKQNLKPEVTQTPPYGCVLVRFPEANG